MTPRRHLRDQTLTVSFQKPWNLLAQTTVAVRNTTSEKVARAKWWSLLKDARTHFETEL
jgi:hypothetical protein